MAMQDYLAALTYPFANSARVPDSYARPTLTVNSTFVFPISVNYLNSSDVKGYGRFSIAVQPHMGSLASPHSYKVAIVKPLGASGQWSEVDWESADAYVDNIDGVDPRLDQYYTTLTQPPVGEYSISQGVSTNNPLPIATTAPYESLCQVWSTYNSGVHMVPGSPNGQNYFRVSPGQYNLHFNAATTAYATTFSTNPGIGLVVGSANDWVLSIPRAIRSLDNTTCSYDALITVKKTVTLHINMPLTSYATTYASVNVSWSPTFFTRATDGGTGGGAAFQDNAYPSGKCGLLTEYRTVGCTALMTYSGTTLNNGGMIAGAFVTGGVLDQGFFTKAPNPVTGQLQNYESLAKAPNACNAEAKNGMYIFWKPEDNDDYAFRDPDYCAESTAESPPALVISGVYAPNGSITATPVFRLMISTVYECTSPTQLFPQKTTIGGQDVLDDCNRLLATQPSAMENPSHLSWMKDFLGGVKQGLGYVEAPAKWLWNNRGLAGL